MSSILIVSPTPTHPATAGNRVRIAALADAMRQLGYDVDLLYLARESGDLDAMRAAWGEGLTVVESRPEARGLVRRLRRAARRLGRRAGVDAAWRFGIDEWYEPGLDRALRALLQRTRYAAVMVEYVFLSRALEAVPPGTLRILDTHDVFSNRHRMYLAEGRTPAWFSCSPQQEARALGRADVVVAIKESEADYFRTLTPGPVVTVGHIARALTPSCVPDAGRHTIAILGSANAINLESTRWFVTEVLPGIRRRVPDVSVVVAGSVCEGLDDAPGVRRLGVVDDVGDVYRSAAVVVNPMRYGTGLKIKTVEAMGYGKALVTTPVGAEGLERSAGPGFRVAASADEFVEAVAGLLECEEARRTAERAARAHLEEYNDQALRQLTEILARASGNGREAIAQ